MVEGEESNSETCLKWGGGKAIKASFIKQLKEEVGKGKGCFIGGRDLEGITAPYPPKSIIFTKNSQPDFLISLMFKALFQIG